MQNAMWFEMMLKIIIIKIYLHISHFNYLYQTKLLQ